MSELLPAPFSPNKAWTSPARNSRLTSLRTATGPNDLLIPTILSAMSFKSPSSTDSPLRAFPIRLPTPVLSR